MCQRLLDYFQLNQFVLSRLECEAQLSIYLDTSFVQEIQTEHDVDVLFNRWRLVRLSCSLAHLELVDSFTFAIEYRVTLKAP